MAVGSALTANTSWREPPDFVARGFTHDEGTFDDVIPLLERALAKAAAEGIGDVHPLEQIIARTVSRWARSRGGRTPIVIPVVVDA